MRKQEPKAVSKLSDGELAAIVSARYGIRGESGDWQVYYLKKETGDPLELVDSFSNRGHALACFTGLLNRQRKAGNEQFLRQRHALCGQHERD